LIVYPRNESDVRKTARFTWQLAERGRVVPITARGGGSDQTGAAIGSGIIMAFTAHLNRVLEFDSKTGIVTVEPGINYGKLQQTLQTHGRFLPPYPASLEYATIGGAVANNAGGEKSVKYGSTREYVKSLRVVLANGEVIMTGRLSKRELDKKLGLSTFEGEIYRSLDTLLEEQKDLLNKLERKVTKNATGYDVLDVKHRDGSFDLTPLFVGSQGTLGIVTEVTLKTETYNPETSLLIAAFDSASTLQTAVRELRMQHELPSALELVDGNLLNLVAEQSPAQLKGTLQPPYPAFVLLAEYDNTGRTQKHVAHKALKILRKTAANVQLVTDIEEQEALWRIRQSAATVHSHVSGRAKALPLIEDGIVPPDQLEALLTGIYALFERNRLPVAVWGHAGDAHLHVYPQLDLSQVGDRQAAYRLMDEYYKLIGELGGSSSGQHGEGRLRGPYQTMVYGPDAVNLFEKVKRIFDPHGTLNPGVKIGVTIEATKPLLRQEYTLGHFHQHMPRS